jgi:hypothetical protein
MLAPTIKQVKFMQFKSQNLDSLVSRTKWDQNHKPLYLKETTLFTPE